ncbi:MAG TPA: hypothetical protein VLG38_00930 [Gammaproteobacteria bacterium]|nr:hypothetical protein [Gammaproteobacteria bacterium]
MPINIITRLFATEESRLPYLKLGGNLVALDDLGAGVSYFYAPDGQQCQVTHRDNCLYINTDADLDVAIIGHFDLDCVRIRTKGQVTINTNRQTIQPKVGIWIEAKNILLKAPVSGPGVLALFADATKTGSVWLGQEINIANAIIMTRKLFTIKEVRVTQLWASFDIFKQARNSHLTVGTASSIDRLPMPTTRNAISEVLFHARELLQHNKKSQLIGKDIILKGGVSGKNLNIFVTDWIIIRSKVVVDNLVVKAFYIYGAIGALLDGKNNLDISMDYLLTFCPITAVETSMQGKGAVAVGSGGSFKGGKKLTLNNLSTWVAFGATIDATNDTVPTGLYVNLAGIVRGYNFHVDTFVSVDLGINIPYWPEDLRNISNVNKLIVAIRLIALNVYKPIGTILKVAYKLYSMRRNVAKTGSIFKTEKTQPAASNKRQFAVEILNLLLTIKAILFAAASVYAAQDFVHECINSCKGTPPQNATNPFAEPFPPSQDVYFKMFENSMPAFLPAYLMDSVVSFNAGWIIQGMRSDENVLNYDTSYTRTLYPLPRLFS